jgi:hypothetical protein
MKYKVVYTIPFTDDPEMRGKVFTEEIVASDTQTARRMVYVKHHNASIQTVDPVRFSG